MPATFSCDAHPQTIALDDLVVSDGFVDATIIKNLGGGSLYIAAPWPIGPRPRPSVLADHVIGAGQAIELPGKLAGGDAIRLREPLRGLQKTCHSHAFALVPFSWIALQRSLKDPVTPPITRLQLPETCPTPSWISERPLRRCGSPPAQSRMSANEH